MQSQGGYSGGRMPHERRRSALVLLPALHYSCNFEGATNKHRYVVASQSQPLRASLRKIPAVPAVHVNRSVMVLEPPSDATLKAKQDVSY